MFFYKINGQRKFDKFGRGWILIYQLNPNLTKSGPLHDGPQTGATPLFICDGKQKWKEVGNGSEKCGEYGESFLWVPHQVMETILLLIWE